MDAIVAFLVAVGLASMSQSDHDTTEQTIPVHDKPVLESIDARTQERQIRIELTNSWLREARLQWLNADLSPAEPRPASRVAARLSAAD